MSNTYYLTNYGYLLTLDSEEMALELAKGRKRCESHCTAKSCFNCIREYLGEIHPIRRIE